MVQISPYTPLTCPLVSRSIALLESCDLALGCRCVEGIVRHVQEEAGRPYWGFFRTAWKDWRFGGMLDKHYVGGLEANGQPEEQVKVVQAITSVIQALSPSDAIDPIYVSLSPIYQAFAHPLTARVFSTPSSTD